MPERFVIRRGDGETGMPIVAANGINLCYDEVGDAKAPVILLIMGLGYSSVMWYRTRPVLAARYRTLAFDNRGVGLSEVPPGPVTTTRASLARFLPQLLPGPCAG